ncbi:hypothetical protein O3P69_014262 [Scylla paramamosain]|uniref:Uncharacterized protein n=1 Tax=Scylla paramamosain TaxID=85552 RepID=A0AAW0TCV0_SCYPA
MKDVHFIFCFTRIRFTYSGILDSDICGPSQLRVLGTAEEKVHSSGAGWSPVEVALLDVRKEITFCRKVNIPIIGLVENMTTFVCPKCKTKTALAEDTGVPLFGQLPLDPQVAQACDEGTNILTQEPDAAVTQAYKDIANKIKEYCEAQSQEAT